MKVDYRESLEIEGKEVLVGMAAVRVPQAFLEFKANKVNGVGQVGKDCQV